MKQELNQYKCSMFRDQEYPANLWIKEEYFDLDDIPDGAIIGIFKAYLEKDQDQLAVWDQGTIIGMSKMRYERNKLDRS